jgi:hypothetical protein
MSSQLLESLLEDLFEIKGMVSENDIPMLVESSIRNRSMAVLLVEGMRNSGEVKKAIEQVKVVLQRYNQALQAAKPAPAYLVKLLARLQKQLESREKGFEKAVKSDDVREHIKYKDSVSDVSILVISALRTIRNSIDAVNKLVTSLGEDAFSSEEQPSEESKNDIEDLEKLIGQTLADKSLGALLKQENRDEFEKTLRSKIDKPTLVGGPMRRFFSGIKNSNLKINSDELIASLKLLTLDDIRDLDSKFKSFDNIVKQATETTEETAEDFQADGADEEEKETEETKEAEPDSKNTEEDTKEDVEDAENSSVEKNRFYKYTNKKGKESIVKVIDVLDNGKAQLAPVIFKNNKMKLSNTVFTVQVNDERIGNKLEQKDVIASFNKPIDRVENTIAGSENAGAALDALADVATDDLVSAASNSKNRMKISREQGVKMFNDIVKDQDKATLLYSTVKRLVNQDVGYDMFESKQEIYSFNRWAQLAGIKKGDK